MKRPKRRIKENFNIIISSGTDVRKQPVVYNVEKKTIAAIFFSALAFIVIILAAGIFLLLENSNNYGEIRTLEQKVKQQNTLIETYSNNLDNLKQSIEQNENTDNAEPSSSQSTASPKVSQSSDDAGLAVNFTPVSIQVLGTALTDEDEDLDTDAAIDPLYDPSLQFEYPGEKPQNGDKNDKIELIDWFEGGSKIFARNTKAIATDVITGKSFHVIRLGGKYHADSEPLTKEDTAVMKEIYGKWSWDRRSIVLQINGRYIAASMHGMPHKVDRVNNAFPGHFCIHLLNSKVHQTGKPCARHQRCVLYAFQYGNSAI